MYVVSLFLLSHWLLALIGVLVVLQLGLTISSLIRPGDCETTILNLPFQLARDGDLFDRNQAWLLSLLSISRHHDSIFRELALEHLDELAKQCSSIASGEFTFEGTETWRIVYEHLLPSSGLHRYRTVAWIKNAHDWQDEPRRKSMAVNFELHGCARLSIERIAIIADDLWPEDDVWPTEFLRQWIHEQNARGIIIKVVRESDLTHEPDFIADIGIHDNRALGIQELDDHCRTIRFTLTFDYAQCRHQRKNVAPGGREGWRWVG